MKTYCRPRQINITDIALIRRAVYRAFSGKLRRRDFQRLLLRTGAIRRCDLMEELRTGRRVHINRALDALAEEMRRDILSGSLPITPVRQFQRVDGLSGKTRVLCKEGAYQQCCEYIAVEALGPLFRAKLLPCQFGSIPGRGQIRGKRRLERIVRRRPGRLTAAKIDIQQAYPSTRVEMVMELLGRDIRKNKALLWFLRATMTNYPGGVLIIGGYLSTWLFNYVMACFLRAVWDSGRVRRGRWRRDVLAMVSYADDAVVFGSSRSGVFRALRRGIRWAASHGLLVKRCWSVTEFSPVWEDDRGAAVDMMGFVVRRRYTTIRGRIWRRIRRQLLRACGDLQQRGAVPWWRAQKINSYRGWIAYSNSQRLRERYHIGQIWRYAAQAVSAHERRSDYASNLYAAAV